MTFIKDQTSDLFDDFSPEKLIGNDSEVLDYINFFDKIDLSDFINTYSGEGQTPIDPKMMLRTIFFALNHGVSSNRKITDYCKYDIRYIVLSGGIRPNRRTFDRFIERHSNNLENFFKQVVNLAHEKGMIGLNHVAIDGSRFKGNTKPYGMKYSKLESTIDKLSKNIKILKKDAKKSIAKDKISGDIKLIEEQMNKIIIAKKN